MPHTPAWEYRIICYQPYTGFYEEGERFQDNGELTMLQTVGAEGWELTQIQFAANFGDAQAFALYYFKRQKECAA